MRIPWMTPKNKLKIAENIIAFMNDRAPLLQESVSFIHSWVLTETSEKVKFHYDVWDIILKKYLPEERPILFRSCRRLSNREIQSFTGKIYTAEKFSERHKGHLLICDTEEYLQFEEENAPEHKHSYFPLCKCIKKGTYDAHHYFSENFYKEYKKEDEYIVRVNLNWIYDLKWNLKKEDL